MIGRFAKKRAARQEKEVHDALVEKIHGRTIRYASERLPDNGGDVILGKDGSLSVRNGQLIVLAGGNIVFRAKTDDLTLSELMSLEGVILEGEDLEHGGVRRRIIAYYTYYR